MAWPHGQWLFYISTVALSVVDDLIDNEACCKLPRSCLSGVKDALERPLARLGGCC